MLKQQKNPQHFMLRAFALVVQPGLEPGAYGLEGRCSNPTELLNHPFSDCKNIKAFLICKIKIQKLLNSSVFIILHARMVLLISIINICVVSVRRCVLLFFIINYSLLDNCL